MNKIRILPLLVLVALLVFTVRLGEFVTDVRQLDPVSLAASESASSNVKNSSSAANGSDKNASIKMAANSADSPTSSTIQKSPLGDDWSDPASIDLDFSGNSDEILQELSARRRELDARERQLEQQAALLKATEQQIDQKITELSTLREDLRSLLDQQGGEEQKQIKSLVKIYEGMKPKEAANIFNTLDMDIMLAVVSRMSERKSAPVLAAMDPNKARALTVLLAKQKQLPENLADNF